MMINKIAFGFAVVMLSAGIVFAGNNVKNNRKTCPNTPTCVCPKQNSNVKQLLKAEVKSDKKDICPNKPGCICTK